MLTACNLLIKYNSTTRNQRDSPLLRLPPEIRIIIWRFALDTASLSLGEMCRRTKLHLLRLCRQINIESKPFVKAFTTLSLEESRPTDKSHIRYDVCRSRHDFASVRRLSLDFGLFPNFNPSHRRCCLGMCSPYLPSQHTGGVQEMFPALERLVLDPFWPLEEGQAHSIRLVFSKPHLEIVCNGKLLACNDV